MTSPSTRALLLLALLGTLCGTSMIAIAQDRGGARREATAPSPADADEDAAGEDVDAESDLVEERGAKVKVIKFTGLDISGRLKSPQLLYFLNRLRAEFSRPRLPHRSFMPELDRSTKSKAF